MGDIEKAQWHPAMRPSRADLKKLSEDLMKEKAFSSAHSLSAPAVEITSQIMPVAAEQKEADQVDASFGQRSRQLDEEYSAVSASLSESTSTLQPIASEPFSENIENSSSHSEILDPLVGSDASASSVPSKDLASAETISTPLLDSNHKTREIPLEQKAPSSVPDSSPTSLDKDEISDVLMQTKPENAKSSSITEKSLPLTIESTHVSSAPTDTLTSNMFEGENPVGTTAPKSGKISVTEMDEVPVPESTLINTPEPTVEVSTLILENPSKQIPNIDEQDFFQSSTSPVSTSFGDEPSVTSEAESVPVGTTLPEPEVPLYSPQDKASHNVNDSSTTKQSRSESISQPSAPVLDLEQVDIQPVKQHSMRDPEEIKSSHTLDLVFGTPEVIEDFPGPQENTELGPESVSVVAEAVEQQAEEDNLFNNDEGGDDFLASLNGDVPLQDTELVSNSGKEASQVFETNTSSTNILKEENKTDASSALGSSSNEPNTKDSFEDLFNDDPEDFSAAIQPRTQQVKKTRPQSTAFLFEGSNDEGEDSFFSGLGGATEAKESMNFLASLDEESNAQPPKEIDEDAFSKALAQDIADQNQPSGKVDIAQSLAFLEDDELLPDDYVEPPKSRASSVVPSHAVTPHADSSAEMNKSLRRQTSFASNVSSHSSSYIQPASLAQQPQGIPPKVPPKTTNNAFDLPTDMVPKPLRRMASFQSSQPTFPFGNQSSAGPPKPALNTKKSFFEELPPIPRKTMSRKTSLISLNRDAPPSTNLYSSGSHSHLPAMGGPPASQYSGGQHALPPRGHSANSFRSGSTSQYTPSSPGQFQNQQQLPSEMHMNATSRTSSPYNPYETPVNQIAPPLNPYSPSIQGQPQEFSQVRSSSQGQIQSPYAPLGQPQHPQQPPVNHYAPPAQHHPTSQSQYAPPVQAHLPKAASPALQPVARLVGQGSFGDMPADIRSQQPLPQDPPNFGSNQILSPPMGEHPSLTQNTHTPSPRGQSSSLGSNAYAPTIAGSSPRKAAMPLTPVNNEALLRRQFPIFQWGITGKAVSVIPPSISFGGGSASPEIKIFPVSQLFQHDVLTPKFPFSIMTSKGSQRNKKKELEKWIEDRIKEGEATVNDARSENSSRQADRVTLWKIMLNLLQADSTSSKPSKTLMEAIRKTLDPFVQVQPTEELGTFAPAVDIYQKNLHRHTSTCGEQNSARALKTEDINCLVDLLKVGQRESALKYALDQHLWAHALIMASSLGPTNWIDAVFEFVREEVRVFPSQSARDLALMYRTFSGAGADSGKYFHFSLQVAASVTNC